MKRKELDDAALKLDAYCQEPRTIDEIKDHLEVNWRDAHGVIHHHRRVLSDDSALVTLNPATGVHLYLVTDDPEQIRLYIRKRDKDTDTRLRTILAVSEAAVAITDGRTAEGKRARLIKKVVGRLVEDLEEIT